MQKQVCSLLAVFPLALIGFHWLLLFLVAELLHSQDVEYQEIPSIHFLLKFPLPTV